ncbi:MAG: type II toxin-antitoxin system RelB/DinJ family antitoxin [Anaerolinea sp.]|nr:type II toxin-antitoxin system RelB/DinJ family antitoxin [Anaerolinea sp.]
MAKTAVITTRIEPEIKEEAENILAQLGLTMSQAMSMYVRQLVLRRGLPFTVNIPNQETMEAIQESLEPEKLPGFDNLDNLFADLEI